MKWYQLTLDAVSLCAVIYIVTDQMIHATLLAYSKHYNYCQALKVVKSI